MIYFLHEKIPGAEACARVVHLSLLLSYLSLCISHKCEEGRVERDSSDLKGRSVVQKAYNLNLSNSTDM